jgi:hypothetical protein
VKETIVFYTNFMKTGQEGFLDPSQALNYCNRPAGAEVYLVHKGI